MYLKKLYKIMLHAQSSPNQTGAGLIPWLLRFLLVMLLGYGFTSPVLSIFAHNIPLNQDHAFITQKILYHTPEAGEVFLVWGINGWAMLPERTQPVGTVVKDGVMHTPMTRLGHTFIAEVQIPSGATIDYVFHITKTRSGATVEVWDTNGQPKRDYHTIALAGAVTEVRAVSNLVRQVAIGTFDIGLQWRGFLILLIGIGLGLGIRAIRSGHISPASKIISRS